MHFKVAVRKLYPGEGSTAVMREFSACIVVAIKMNMGSNSGVALCN